MDYGMKARVGRKSPTDASRIQLGRTRAHINRVFRFPAALPEGPHPIPSRTRKLSPPGPMVLHGRPCGRVGRRRSYSWAPSRKTGGLFFARESAGSSHDEHEAAVGDVAAVELYRLGIGQEARDLGVWILTVVHHRVANPATAIVGPEHLR